LIKIILKISLVVVIILLLAYYLIFVKANQINSHNAVWMCIDKNLIRVYSTQSFYCVNYVKSKYSGDTLFLIPYINTIESAFNNIDSGYKIVLKNAKYIQVKDTVFNKDSIMDCSFYNWTMSHQQLLRDSLIPKW
jgi:hypothetical protein